MIFKLRKGFSIAEIAIAIILLAILTGFAVTNFSDMSTGAKTAKAKQELDSVLLAMQTYVGDGQSPSGTDISFLTAGYTTSDGLVKEALIRKEGWSTTSVPTDPWGHPYVLDVAAGTVCSQGPNTADPGGLICVTYQ